MNHDNNVYNSKDGVLWFLTGYLGSGLDSPSTPRPALSEGDKGRKEGNLRHSRQQDNAHDLGGRSHQMEAYIRE